MGDIEKFFNENFFKKVKPGMFECVEIKTDIT
jgi:hypothetical protein